ncbi:hypothetical protein IFM89_038246 [Coptis chinensis]|uniref:Phytocyanin domain-containing protein n=1 Tax=Coptis chinensis TaxID=261450 RepID=A0A835M1X3_9MAGN|nr:hypothetical protein IFM89_038246 [Coptis chinensis]
MKAVYKILLVIYLALGATEVLATQHVVTWDVSTDLNSWASGRTFKVGDQLVFKYMKGLHSLLELSSEKEYKNCNIGNAADSKNGGNDVVKLTKPGTRYFACGTLGHCDQGMKLKIKTVASNGSSQDSSQDSPSSSSTTTSNTPTSAAPSSRTFGAFALALASYCIGLLYILD